MQQSFVNYHSGSKVLRPSWTTSNSHEPELKMQNELECIQSGIHAATSSESPCRKLALQYDSRWRNFGYQPLRPTSITAQKRSMSTSRQQPNAGLKRRSSMASWATAQGENRLPRPSTLSKLKPFFDQAAKLKDAGKLSKGKCTGMGKHMARRSTLCMQKKQAALLVNMHAA